MTTKTASKNAGMHAARKAKNDEFYTQLSDIEKELKNYRDHFRGKTIFLNCDDPEWSNFWIYFRNNFNFLGIQRVIATHYTGATEGGAPSYALELVRGPNGEDVDVEKPIRTELAGDGDFRSPEAVAYLEQADIVVTNPPFSLFREYVAQLIEHDKKFVLIGNKNAITYKEVWPLIGSGKMWIGQMPMGQDLLFGLPEVAAEELRRTKQEGSSYRVVDGKVFGRASAIWFTNIEIPRRYEDIPLYKRYADDPDAYPAFDNYDAIEVSKVKDIPKDYDGAMGVPITFLGKHNPGQFEILDANGIRRNGDVKIKPHGLVKDAESSVGGRARYVRIIIRRIRDVDIFVPDSARRWESKVSFMGEPFALQSNNFDCPCGSGNVSRSDISKEVKIECLDCDRDYEVIFLGAGPKKWTLARKAGDAV